MLEIIKSKKGFFMPTIIVYLIFLFSFIGFQVVQTTDSMLLVREQRLTLELHAIRNNVINFIKDDLQHNYHNGCLIPTTYEELEFSGSKVYIKRNCIRKPGPETKDPLIKENKSQRLIDQYIKTGGGKVDKTFFDYKRIAIATLSSLEIFNSWIGVPIDPSLLSPFELEQYLEIQTFGIYYYYTVDIKYNNDNYDMLLIGETGKDNIDYLLFT